MLKFRYDSTNSWQALEIENISDTTNAIVKLDLPEDMFMLKASAAVVNANEIYMSPTNFDRFNRLLD